MTEYEAPGEITRDFFRQRIDRILGEPDDEDGIRGFTLDIPDHLPSSPLCPLNPKHKSGGKTICPLHGRAKNVRMT